MKLLKRAKNQLVFQLARREKELMLHLLSLYPQVPPAHQRLSKSGQLPDGQSAQQLLEEALAEHRTESKKQVQALLTDPKHWTEHRSGWQLSLSTAEVEWLLQVLNDIRVGSWVALGSPEEKIEMFNEETAPHVWAMEAAGLFQVFLLGALEAGDEGDEGNEEREGRGA